jgi:hypothetical protein
MMRPFTLLTLLELAGILVGWAVIFVLLAWAFGS